MSETEFKPVMKNGVLFRKIRKDKGRPRNGKFSRVAKAVWKAFKKEMAR